MVVKKAATLDGSKRAGARDACGRRIEETLSLFSPCMD
jgi:hypothetical protein